MVKENNIQESVPDSETPKHLLDMYFLLDYTVNENFNCVISFTFTLHLSVQIKKGVVISTMYVSCPLFK